MYTSIIILFIRKKLNSLEKVVVNGDSHCCNEYGCWAFVERLYYNVELMPNHDVVRDYYDIVFWLA